MSALVEHPEFGLIFIETDIQCTVKVDVRGVAFNPGIVVQMVLYGNHIDGADILVVANLSKFFAEEILFDESRISFGNQLDGLQRFI